MFIELYHDTDPRYLFVHSLPDRITIDDLYNGVYGKVIVFPFPDVDIVYRQPDGPGTDWVKP